MPAELRLADVLSAVETFGARGGFAEEIAIAAGVAAKTAKKHLRALVADDLVAVDRLQIPRGTQGRKVYYLRGAR